MRDVNLEAEISLPCSHYSTTCPYPEKINPIYALSSYLFKICFNIILQSASMPLSFRFPQQNPSSAFLVSRTRYILCPSYSLLFANFIAFNFIT